MARHPDGVSELGAARAQRCPWTAPWTAPTVTSALEPLLAPARRERLRRVLAARIDSVTLLMDAPHDPHNGAAVLRSAEAFGVQEIHVVPRGEPFLASNKIARGTQRWVDTVQHASPQSAIAALRARSYTLVATDPTGTLMPEDLATIPRVCLILGNERDGICEQLTRAADGSVRIPMRGFVESLNVSVSAAILLAAATEGRAGDLHPERADEIYARWLYRATPNAARVLAALAARLPGKNAPPPRGR